MKTYTQNELYEVLELHIKWLKNDSQGIQADLRGANLSGTDLRNANLMNANLRNVNLTDANLMGANLKNVNLIGASLIDANLKNANLSGANLMDAYLRSANLIDANLRGAYLRGANLSGSRLKRVNLRGANLTDTIGDMNVIKSIQCEKYLITYTSNMMYIGCQSHSIAEWKDFNNDEIENMDEGALEWWIKWKPIIMQIIELSPAEGEV